MSREIIGLGGYLFDLPAGQVWPRIIPQRSTLIFIKHKREGLDRLPVSKPPRSLKWRILPKRK